MNDSFGSRATLRVGGRELRLARLDALEKRGFNVSRLPYALRILLENLLRREDGPVVTADEIEALAGWDPKAIPVARDRLHARPASSCRTSPASPPWSTSPPCATPWSAMGGDPKRINPLQPVELVIDHSVQVDEYGTAAAFLINAEKEFERNRERYAFLRWGQTAFSNFRVVPPGHRHRPPGQPRVPGAGGHGGGRRRASATLYPDTLVGTDSHTTMVNGLGVLGWGVGGIEAEAAMLGQPVSMLIPQVVGFRLAGEAARGGHRHRPRAHRHPDAAQEGRGRQVRRVLRPRPRRPAARRPRHHRQHGARVRRHLRHLPGRPGRARLPPLHRPPPEQVALVEAYMKEQGLFHTADSPEAAYTDILELDLGTVEPSLAGPRRPQDRVRLSDVKPSFLKELEAMTAAGQDRQGAPRRLRRSSPRAAPPRGSRSPSPRSPSRPIPPAAALAATARW